MVKTAAGIILYNPDEARLKENIEAIIEQVDIVVLVDNGSANIRNIEQCYAKYNTIHFLNNKNNIGIAKALNQLVKFAKEEGCMWAVTLDQDSVCSKNMVSEYIKYISDSEVGIICPRIQDRNDMYEKKDETDREYVEQCITSGSFINIQCWDTNGGFDSKMFIDFVDFEYCIRVRENGFRILRLNYVKLLHQCGDLKVVNIVGRKVQITNHNPFRCYYYSRNVIYCNKKHPKYFPRRKMLKLLFEKIVKITFFEKEKKKKLSAIYKGIRNTNEF